MKDLSIAALMKAKGNAGYILRTRQIELPKLQLVLQNEKNVDGH